VCLRLSSVFIPQRASVRKGCSPRIEVNCTAFSLEKVIGQYASRHSCRFGGFFRRRTFQSFCYVHYLHLPLRQFRYSLFCLLFCTLIRVFTSFYFFHILLQSFINHVRRWFFSRSVGVGYVDIRHYPHHYRGKLFFRLSGTWAPVTL